MPGKDGAAAPRTVSTGDWLETGYLTRLAGRVALQYGLGAEDSADLLQEVRIALWEQGLATRVSAAWVFRVASCKAVDLLRRQARERRRERSFASSAPCVAHDPEFDHLLRAQAAVLPAKLRKFYDLHYVQGWSEREIAAAMGLCRASVRWLDRCCRRHLAGDSQAQPAKLSGALARPSLTEKQTQGGPEREGDPLGARKAAWNGWNDLHDDDRKGGQGARERESTV